MSVYYALAPGLAQSVVSAPPSVRVTAHFSRFTYFCDLFVASMKATMCMIFVMFYPAMPDPSLMSKEADNLVLIVENGK